MSHALNINNGKAAMAYYGEEPWHKLGQKVDHAMTAAEAITAAGLDYEVEKRPIFVKNSNIKSPLDPIFEPVKDQFAVVRKDTNDTFAVVGRVYRPLQNKEAFSFFDSIVGTKEAMYHTAGALFKGQKIWLLAKLPGTIEVAKDDTVEKYLLLYNTHDGTSTVQIMFTPIRVVCYNTLSSALGEAGDSKRVKLRHTINIASNLDGVRDQLGIANSYYKVFEEMSKHLVSKNVTQSTVDALLESLNLGKVKADESTRTANIRDQIINLYENGKGNSLPGVRGTAWALWNGVTEFADHYKTIRAKGTDENSSRVSSILFGSGADLKQTALDNLLAIVK